MGASTANPRPAPLSFVLTAAILVIFRMAFRPDCCPIFSRSCRKGSLLSPTPPFTNPTNMSMITGAPPKVHGISGNYYLDKATGREVMITDASLVSSGTVLAALADAGVRIAAITAKDKLRKMLGSGLKGICFSSERACEATLKENGIDEVERLVGRPTPDMYSPDLSLFVLDAGIRLLETRRAEVLYLSLSDMVQHSAGPGEELADSFNREVDKRVGRMLELDAVVAIVADHGMTDKCTPDGQPQIVYL